MADCVCLPGCPFFNDKMPDTGGLGSIYKRKYCQGDNASCARFMVFTKLGKGFAPPDLYPNMIEKAAAIIKAAEK